MKIMKKSVFSFRVKQASSIYYLDCLIANLLFVYGIVFYYNESKNFSKLEN